jgi:hypothetical protein
MPPRVGVPITARPAIASPYHGRHRRAAQRRAANVAARSSIALMASAIGSGLLTFAFWLVVARGKGAQGVGSAAAEISTVTFLAGVGSLNMINVFARFLPEAGGSAQRLIVSSYGATLIAGSGVACVFLATPVASRLIIGGTGGKIGFVVLVVTVSIFMIQDGGLIGFGKAVWVPVENTLVGVVRLITLPIIATVVVGAGGALWSWSIATGAAVLVVNMILILRLAPALSDQASRLPVRRSLIKFIAIESVTTAVSSSVSAFLPAIVADSQGSTTAGYFYIPWLVATTVALLLQNILIAMVREAVANPGTRVEAVKGQLKLGSLIVLGGVAACSAFPHEVLRVLGVDFANHGAGLLRWIGFSIPGTAVGLLYWSLCLLRQRPWPLFLMNVVNSVAMIGGILEFRHIALTSIGMLFCGVQWTIAVGVAIPLARALRGILNPNPVDVARAPSAGHLQIRSQRTSPSHRL